MNRIIMLVVDDLAKKYGFDAKEAIDYLSSNVHDKPKTNKIPCKKEKIPQEKKIPLPWLGNIDDTKCQALTLNYGLYTQCFHEPIDGKYCAKCIQHGKKHGLVQERSDPTFNGKNKKPVIMYGKVLKDRGISREEAECYARTQGIVIPNEYFELKKSKKRKTQEIHDPNIELEEETDDEFPQDINKCNMNMYKEEEEEDEYEEITCSVIEIDNTLYLHDICNNNVYSKEEGNPFIGKYHEDTKQIDFNAEEE